MPEPEIENIWSSAKAFTQEVREEKKTNKEETKQEEKIGIIEEASEAIQSNHKFVTIEETREILYYSNGRYIKGGEVLIEKKAETSFGYQLSNQMLAEIKGHIMRMTYRSHTEFDKDICIMNMNNGLYNFVTGELKQHNPNYLSINQVPIIYNLNAKPQLFGKYLKEVLYAAEINNIYSILTALHGIRNTSNVPLYAMLKDVFALSDLENKNIDSELSGATIYDTAILKKLTGRQPIRIQRKNQRAYDVILHAKLFFSANKIPISTDDTDTYYRRNVIISFPNKFEGDKDDPSLTAKLTTEEELSFTFNVLMIALHSGDY